MQPTPEAGQSSARNQSPHPDQRPDLTERLKMPLTGALQLAVALENIPQLTALGLGGVLVWVCGYGHMCLGLGLRSATHIHCAFEMWHRQYRETYRKVETLSYRLFTICSCLRDVAWLWSDGYQIPLTEPSSNPVTLNLSLNPI